MVAVALNSESNLSTGTPVTLFQAHARPYVSSTDIFTYDVTADGKRFLVDRYVKPEQTPPLSIILHATGSSE